MSAPLSPTSTTSSGKLRRDTGFPEPFCGTTLPHPDADTSPNASISASDVDPHRATRRSIRARKRYRHTLAHGKIRPEESAESLDDAATLGGEEELEEVQVLMTPDGRISKDLSVEEARASFGFKDDEGRKRGLIKRILRQ